MAFRFKNLLKKAALYSLHLNLYLQLSSFKLYCLYSAFLSMNSQRDVAQCALCSCVVLCPQSCCLSSWVLWSWLQKPRSGTLGVSFLHYSPFQACFLWDMSGGVEGSWRAVLWLDAGLLKSRGLAASRLPGRITQMPQA